MMGRKFPVKWNSEKQRWDDPPTVDCSADFKAGRMAVQADRDEVDINKIIARVKSGGSLPVFNGEPFYGDVSDLGGLQEAYLKVQEAEALFMEFPANVRERFENDPVKMVSFLEDPGNLDEAVRLGLAVKRPQPVLPPAPAVPPEPPANLGPK